MTQNIDIVYELFQLLEGNEYKKILKRICEHLNVERAFLLNYYENYNTTDMVIGWNMGDEIHDYLKNLDIEEYTQSKEQLAKGIPVFIGDVEHEKHYPKLIELLKRTKQKSAVLVPIRDANYEIIGILGIADESSILCTEKNNCIKILEILTYNLKYNWEDEVLKLKFNSLIQNSASAIVILDRDGKIIELNNNFEKLANSSKDELKNKKYFFNFIAQDEKDIIINRHYDRRENNEVVSDYDFNFVDSDNRKKEVNVKVKMIPGTKKSVCSLLDITHKKQTENLLKLQEEKLTESYNQLKKSRDQLESTYLDLIDKNIENERLLNNIEKLIDLMSSLHISKGNNLNNFLAELLYTALEIVEVADYGSVYVFNDNDYIEYIETVGHNLEKLNQIEIEGKPFRYNSDEIEIVDNILEENKKYMSDYISKQIKEASLPIKQSIPVILKEKNYVFGGICIDITQGSKKEFSQDDKRLIISFKNLANTFFKLERYNRLNSQFNKELVNSLLNFLKQHDIYTNDHSENVAELSLKIANKMDLNHEEKNDTYWTGMLHDMGKLIIPARILNKKGSLTEKEYDIIKKHPTLCYNALKDSDFLKTIAQYVLYHHERWDGRGYPEGLKKDETPLISRIIAVADAWDAMRSKRAYRNSLSKEKAKKEIKINKGIQFDPEIADLLLEIIE
ncbi:MAG TPA: HD domain-containing phosphohydrolase [Halanaerobiales bacterium]|nr:HD domain-containing phosphohydrolase [Halanaerobiales bacterium]